MYPGTVEARCTHAVGTWHAAMAHASRMQVGRPVAAGAAGRRGWLNAVLAGGRDGDVTAPAVDLLRRIPVVSSVASGSTLGDGFVPLGGSLRPLERERMSSRVTGSQRDTDPRKIRAVDMTDRRAADQR